MQMSGALPFRIFLQGTGEDTSSHYRGLLVVEIDFLYFPLFHKFLMLFFSTPTFPSAPSHNFFLLIFQSLQYLSVRNIDAKLFNGALVCFEDRVPDSSGLMKLQ